VATTVVTPGAVVDRHDDDAIQQAAPEGDDPLRPVFAPEQNLVALPKTSSRQARSKSTRGSGDLGVRIVSAP